MDEHSLHSPFFYDLYTKAIRPKGTPERYETIESIRRKLLQNENYIDVEDFGAGAVYTKSNRRRIRDIARTSITPGKFSRLYQRLIHHFNSKVILELGTSFGVNTLYLAAKQDAIVYTFEGAKNIVSIAKQNFESAGAGNIRLIEGDINTTLPAFLATSKKIDFAFIDANHRYTAMKNYFHWLLPMLQGGSIVLFDDIHSTAEMTKAWTEIKQHTLVYGSIDLFRCGIVFFDPSLNKQDFVLQF